jgi:indole-3-glycerol phosphate synthase
MILDEIVSAKRAARTPFDPVDLPVRQFAAALRGGGLSVIAEFKRKSPSAGVIRAGADPAEIARAYQRAGASAISVLTDRAFFDGDPAHVAQVKAAVSLPVLRKDFLLDERDVSDSRAMGADAVLLIARILDDAALAAMLGAARALGMDALVETHDDAEIARAIAAGAEIIGVNHRDLDTLRIDLSLSARAREKILTRILVAESGIRTPDDVRRMRAHGADAILVGEHLMKAADPGAALVQLCS